MDQPGRCCDLVLKGGVTSGVVYPAAVREIARKFHFVGIGGTSAGAIAACGTAAAEYRRRRTGSLEGFERLEEVARELAAPGALPSLFRPDRGTRPLFRLTTRFLSGRAGLLDRLEAAWRLLFARESSLRPLADNGFGLCSGMGRGADGEGEPITAWLHRTLNEVAGLPEDRPLTFDDLHAAPRPEPLGAVLGDGPSIDLRAISTCLTFGRPYEIPFPQDVFAFDPVEWSRLFPAGVVQHLENAAASTEAPHRTRDGKLPLPRTALPVVVAARMSLSFPGLFSMVPLWAVNYGREEEPLERVWFSDGGITSNFPIHRFDSLYPRWPTIGVNLQYTGPSRTPARRRLAREGGFVFLPEDRREGVLDTWHPVIRGKSATGDVLGFAAAVFRAAQVWHDNAYLRLPGYRDRVVEIWLTPEEGGLNLEMHRSVVEALIGRGTEAGARIATRFADEPGENAMSWEGHRWTRFRSAMAGLAQALRAFERNASSPMPGDPPLAEALADRHSPPCYLFTTEEQAVAARHATEDLLEVVAGMRGLGVCRGAGEEMERPFCNGPRPRVEIGSRAPF